MAAGSAALTAAGCAGDSRGMMGMDEPPGKYDDPSDGICPAPTSTDALGPYWTSNVRQTIQLATPGEVGQRLVVHGRIYANDCATIVPGAMVVAWQADDQGLYDYNHAGLNQGAAAGELTEEMTRLRGRTASSVAGTYAFETIVPREYPLNLLDPASSAFRAPHIHFAVFYSDASGMDHQLVTQMYFEANDLMASQTPNIEDLNAADGGASTAEPERFITVLGDSESHWRGQFDIVLPLAASDVV